MRHIIEIAWRKLFICALLLCLQTAKAVTLYWDTSGGSGNGVGGSGTWGTTFSTTSIGDEVLTTAATGDDIHFQGSSGIITLGASQTVNSLTFNTTGYSIATSGSAARTLTSVITLASDVTLNLSPLSTAPLTLNKAVSGGTNAAMNVGGTNASATDVIRINLDSGGSGGSIAASAPITITTAGDTGLAGFVSIGGARVINATITNNTSTLTMLGATSGNSIEVAGVVSGTAGVQFSAGINGGTGDIRLSAAGAYTGETRFNGGSTGTVQLRVTNGISTASNVIMGYSSGNGQALDLNGFDQTVASLASNAGGTGSITNRAAGSGTNTLTINGSTSTSFGLVISDGTTRKIALTKLGTSTLTLTNASTYSGATTISGGTLDLGSSGALTATSNVTINTGGTLLLSGAGDQINNAATVTLAGGTIQTNAASSINESVGALTLSSTSTIDFGTLVAGNTLSFADSSAALWSGILNVWNWTSGTDHLFFGSSSSGLTGAQLSQINLYSDSGSTFVGNGGINGFGEISGISAVPEPSSVFMAFSLFALIGWRERRWFLRCREARRVG